MKPESINTQFSLSEVSARINHLFVNPNHQESQLLDLTRVAHLSGLPSQAIAKGFIDLYDGELGKRYILSPYDLQLITDKFNNIDNPNILLPTYKGIIRGESVDMMYLYEIPVNTVSFKSVNMDLVTKDQDTLLGNISTIKQQLLEANSELPATVFTDLENHWSYNTDGQIILTYPLSIHND